MDVCSVCASPNRDSSVVCVVSDPKDVAAIERSHEYTGLYHVLHGVISPMSHIGPDDIKIKELISRVAVHGVLSGEIGGLTCVIYGCGPIGVMGVGTAHASGASKVFAMDVFDDKLALAAKMGADVTINTAKEDAVKIVLEATGGKGVDVVVDFTGNNAAICDGFKMLKKGGRFTFVGLPGKDITMDLVENVIYKEAHCNGVTGRLMYKTWYQCCDLLKSGKLDIRPVIGGIYELCDFEKAFDDIAHGAPGKMIFKV